MKNSFSVLIFLYIFIFVCILILLGFLVYISEISGNDPKPIQDISIRVTSILEVLAGAVVGSLSTAVAFVFRDKKTDDKDK